MPSAQATVIRDREPKAMMDARCEDRRYQHGSLPMRDATRRRQFVRLLLVLTLSALVYAGRSTVSPAGAQSVGIPSSAPRAKAKRTPDTANAKPADTALPRAVTDMVDLIREAVQSGRIEDLADAVDWNEMKPDFGPGFVSDPVAYWKSISKDRQGSEILDVLGKLLAGNPAVRPLGRDLENSRLYIWPSFADTPLSGLSPVDRDALAALVPADLLPPMRAKDRYLGWRLTLGADGTWHSFRQD